MLDAELLPENLFPDSLTNDQLHKTKKLSSEQRLETIAYILAVAAHRHRFRKANNVNELTDITDFSATSGEGLDLSVKTSVIHDNRVL